MSMIAGPDERAGLDVAEAHSERLGLEIGEFAGGVKPGHGQVVAGRAQILADGEDVAADGGQVAEDLKKLGGFFTEAHHDAGLGEPFGP